jgi:hypothetical protein
MSSSGIIERDERTVAVERAGGHWAYFFLSYCLLLDVAYRSFVRHEAAWDLLALVIVGGGVSAAYQARHKVLYRNWVIAACAAAVIAGLIAVLLALV